MVEDWLGPGRAEMVRLLLARQEGGGHALRVVQVLALAVGASGFFGQLKDSVETIWGTRREELGLKKVKKALLEMLLAFSASLLILATLAAGLFFKAMIARPEAERLVAGGRVFWQGLEVAALLLVTLVCAAMFKVLPEVRLTWRDVLPGAAVTALVYLLGRVVATHYWSASGHRRPASSRSPCSSSCSGSTTPARPSCSGRSSPGSTRSATAA